VPRRKPAGMPPGSSVGLRAVPSVRQLRLLACLAACWTNLFAALWKFLGRDYVSGGSICSRCASRLQIPGSCSPLHACCDGPTGRRFQGDAFQKRFQSTLASASSKTALQGPYVARASVWSVSTSHIGQSLPRAGDICACLDRNAPNFFSHFLLTFHKFSILLDDSRDGISDTQTSVNSCVGVPSASNDTGQFLSVCK
jgi:hypothetical protein